MKSRGFRLLLSAALLEGMWAWLALFREPSMERNTVLWRYSAARLALGAAFTLVLGGIAVAAVIAFANRKGMDRFLARLEDRLLKGRFLLLLFAVLVCAALAGLAGVLLAESGLLADLSILAAVYRRARPLMVWGTAVCVQGAVWLACAYPAALRDREFLRQSWCGMLARLRQWWVPLVLLALCVAVLAPNLPALAVVPGHDSGIFLYFGSQILRGKLPYRDLWDHKPPLIFYLDALGLWLGGGSRMGLWFLELSALAAAALLAFYLLKRLFGVWPAGIAAAATILNLTFLLEGGNLTEEFALPFQFLALVLFANAREAERSWKWVLSGVAAGLAFLLKQTMVGVWAALGVVLLLESAGNHDWRAAARRLLWIGTGGGAVCAVAALFFALQHTLYDFWDVAFRYNFIYSGAGAAERLLALKEILAELLTRSPYFLIGLVSWVVGAAYFLRHSRRETREPAAMEAFVPLLSVAVLDVPMEVLLISTSTKNYLHYFMVLLPAFSLLIAFLVHLVLSAPARVLTRSATAFFILALFLPPAGFIVEHLRQQPNLQVSQTVEYILGNTDPSERVLVWGTQTVVNYVSGRESPTRFVHQKPLFRAGYASDALSAEFLAGITAAPPRLIINTWLPSTPFVEIAPDGTCGPPQAGYPQSMQPVFDFICRDYRLVEVLGKDRWQVLEYTGQD